MHDRGRWLTAGALGPVTAFLLAFSGAATAAGADAIDFALDIQPILSERCYQCHGPDAAHRMANLRLDDEASAKASVIVPGDPDASEFMARILSTDPLDQMPPPEANRKAISEEEADLLRRWILEGAPWSDHWAFVRPERPAPPAAQDATWARSPIDQFVLARIEAAGLEPAPDAARETWLRRVSFDLTGLPPTLAEIEEFLADDSPQAAARVVDRLLASPAYGERMAMDWLDGARYADTNGFQNDFAREMWLWRDWVIDAFNANMPYDQFTIEQIAGDLLPNATDSQRIATGFNRNNRSNTEGGGIEEEWYVENRVDRVDTTGSVFLGLSMSCARCHDHKYDPISQRDFFSFYAFFNSTADRGFYEETRGNTGPAVAVPSFENQVAMAAFDERIAALQSELDIASSETDANFAEWLETAPQADPPVLGRTLDLHLPLLGRLDEGMTAPESGMSWRLGLLGPSLHLEGAPGAHPQVDAPLPFANPRGFTVSVWVRPEAAGAIFSKMKEDDTYHGVDLLVDAEGRLRMHLVHDWPDDALLAVTEAPALPLGHWSHVAAAYDASGKVSVVSFYVNGHAVPAKAERDQLSGSVENTAPLRIGSRPKELHYRGGIADFRVYNRALPQRRIEELITHTLGASLANLEDERRALHREFFERRGDPRVRELRERLAAEQAERAEYVKDKVPTVMVMEELPEQRPAHLLIRGEYDNPDKSEDLYPAVPEFLPPLPDGAPRNRLGLALWLVDRENPLTARVMVNRLWEKFFGEGLVRTPEDFGVQSQPPTHPELLDWLAVEFMESGWDLKALQRRIALSRVYWQDSAATPELLERDPKNRLLARGPRFRLPAELIRDNALAVSGLLVPAIGGPSVMPYQPDGLWDELAGGAGQGPYVLAEGDDLYRRSLYTYRKRTVPHPTLATFDAPSFEICWVKRSRTNTPMQALALLNDVTYVEAARHLAERMLREANGPGPERIRHGFRLATGRAPTERETEILARGLTGYRENFAADPAEGEAFVTAGESAPPEDLDTVELAAFTAVAGVLLNLDETITKE